MREQDPFADADFADRTAKLLGMLSTGHAAEADTARRKLLEHLGMRGLSMTDLAQRLHQPPATAALAGGDDPRLRQLREENQRLLRVADATRRQARTLEARSRRALRRAMWSGGLAGAAVMAVLALFVTLLAPWHQEAIPAALPARAEAPPAEASILRAGEPLPGAPQHTSGRPGHIAVRSAVLLTAPLPHAPPEAVLPGGTPVRVLRTMETGGHLWLLVETASGNGYLDSALVGP